MRQQIIDLIFTIAKEKDAFNTLENQLLKKAIKIIKL